MTTIHSLDHGYPIDHLKLERRILADKLIGENPPTEADIRKLAILQQAIEALKAVIAERDA